VLAARCPACGARGTAVLGFGPAASPADGDVTAALQHLHTASTGPEE